MARRKRTSKALDVLRQRLAGLKQITPKPDLGPALSVETLEAEINGFIADQDAYNGELALLDERTNRLDIREQNLADLSRRVLAAIKGQYGPDSNEVEQVGGTRR